MTSSKKKNFKFNKTEIDFDSKLTDEEIEAEKERFFEWLDELEKNLGESK